MICGAFQNGGCHVGTKLEEMLPQEREIGGIARAGPVQQFAGKRLVEYINGGAELYFAYGFRDAVAARYRLADGSEVAVEIYQVDRPENAYGLYSFDSGGSHPDVGHEAVYAAGLLKFWKGAFFVRILADSDTDEIKELLVRIGQSIADKIEERGDKPDIVKRVPAAGVVPESLQYFHKQICLNNIYYLADVNVLHLDENTDAISYRYGAGDGVVRVLLVQYPTDAAASAAFRDFLQTYLERDEAVDDGEPVAIQRIENGTFCGVKLTDRSLALVFESPDQETCGTALERACGREERE
jgi:hypothetical protein